MIDTTDVSSLAPLDHTTAVDLQRVELDRAVELLSSLSTTEWSAQTDCPDWDVRRMYLHVLGACEAGASMREMMHQMRAGMRRRKRHGGPLEAALSSIQVEERIELGTDELISRLTAVAPRTVRKRRSMPGVMRNGVRMKVDGPVVETWRIGYLVGPIYLRDLWLHRIDACRAIGRSPLLTAEHDGRIVADVVAEWARRHGRAFRLELEGPAGGSFRAEADAGADGDEHVPSIRMDAVEFCRQLAGRPVDADAVTVDGDATDAASATTLLSTIVPF